MLYAQIWWKNNITNSTGGEIGILAAIAGYKKMVDKPTHVVNDSSSCNDLILCSNKKIQYSQIMELMFPF